METIDVTIRGKAVQLTGTYHSSGSFVMDAIAYEDRYKLVKRVDCNPATGTMLLYAQGGELISEYDPKKDHNRFCLDWSLNSMAFVKDQFIDGAKFSDWYYFTMHVNALYRSCMWGLMNKFNFNHFTAKHIAKQAIKEVKDDLKYSRGVDLDQPQSAEDAANDMELENREATRQLYNLTRK